MRASIGAYDVMVVDRMLPGLDGLSLLKTLRGAKNRTPILLLTALDGVDDRIDGLNAGADDYFAKPFAFGELSARIAALARRPQMIDEPTLLRVRDLEMNLLTPEGDPCGAGRSTCCRESSRCSSTCSGARAGSRPGQCCWRPSGTSISIRRPTWSRPMSRRLRAKIDKPFESELIRTVRGAGYQIDAE